jgi:rhodanese-related sulfurtransferase
MDAPSVTAVSLLQSLGSNRPPLVIDVRKRERFLDAVDMIRGALRRDPLGADDWRRTLPAASSVVTYCVHGHEVSQNACKSLRDAGIDARFLEGGIEGWRSAGGELAAKPAGASTRWVTRERPKIDRIACPWLVSRFIDPDAEFLYVPASDVRQVATDRHATPYDVPGVEFTHEGEACSFDAFLERYRLGEPALEDLALIVRGADTGRLDLAPQAAGLAAVSLGLSRLFADDHEMLRHGMVMYDALYRWCREGKQEAHTWNPDAMRQTAGARGTE